MKAVRPLNVNRCEELNHSELHPPGFADHVLVPWRVPDQLHVGFVDAVDAQDLALGVVRDGRSHAAARRGQGHFHFDLLAAFGFIHQPAIVNQTEVDNIHRNFGVEALLELLPDRFFIDGSSSGRFGHAIGRGGLFKTERVQILLRNTREAVGRGNGVAPAQGLRDHALRSRRDRYLVPARDLDRLAVAAQSEFSVLVHLSGNLICHRFTQMKHG
jgi:hypothetical protein